MNDTEEARKAVLESDFVTVSEARERLADLANRVEYGNRRVIITRHGKPVAVLVSAADFLKLQQIEAA